MKAKQILGRLLFGTEFPQEYLCTGLENFLSPFRVVLRIPEKEFTQDVTGTHLFLGYKPLIIGVPVERNDNGYNELGSAKEIILEFKFDNKNIATLLLKPVEEKYFQNRSLFIFEGIKGKHKFISAFHRFTNKLRYELKAKRNGNVFLPGNLYEQVHIAYSMPRKISIITLGDGTNYNMFPTDLHGEINNDYYVVSLRHEGKASQQVEELKKIAISSVKAEYFSQAYSLGKNHMQELKPAENFKFGELRSENFKLPLPEMIINYCELEHTGTITCGIHKLHFFKITNRHTAENISPALSHIHKFYAEWRKNNNLETKFFIR
jgi:hypothetical protein